MGTFSNSDRMNSLFENKSLSFKILPPKAARKFYACDTSHYDSIVDPGLKKKKVNPG